MLHYRVNANAEVMVPDRLKPKIKVVERGRRLSIVVSAQF